MRNPKDFFRPLAAGAPQPVTEIPFRPSRMIHFFDPSNPKMASAGGAESGMSSLSALGLTVAPAPDGAGVAITGVEPDSAAADHGLKPGDVILEVAGKEVHGPSDVRNALTSSEKKRVLMLVRSGEDQRFIALPTKQG